MVSTINTGSSAEFPRRPLPVGGRFAAVRRFVVGVIVVAMALAGVLGISVRAVPQGPAATSLALDTSVSYVENNVIVSPAVSTTVPNELLTAFIQANGDVSCASTAVITSTPALAWTENIRSNTKPGDAEIWSVLVPSATSNITVTAAINVAPSANCTAYSQQLTVLGFQNVNTTTPIGQVAATSGTSGTPSVGLTTVANNARVYADGNNFDGEVVTPTGGQVIVDNNLAASGDTYWTQTLAAPVATSGTLATVSDTTGGSDRWNMAAVEIDPSGASAPTQLSHAVSFNTENFTQKTVPPITTSGPNELLLATVHLSPGGANDVTGITGGGLTWTRAAHSNANGGAAEIWWAAAPTALTATSFVVHTSNSDGTYIVITALRGANLTAPIGATQATTGSSGTPSLSLTTTAANSWLVSAAVDPDSAASVVATTGTIANTLTLPHGGGAVMWDQENEPAAAPSGTGLSVADSSPNGDDWNMAGVEVMSALTSVTTVTSSANPSVVGQSITYTGTVTPAAPVATGTLNFFDGGVAISGCSAVALNGSAQAQCTPATYTAVAGSPHSITAVYSGDTTYAGSTSAALTQTVNQASTTGSIGVSPEASLTPGEPATFTASLAAVPPGAGTPGGTVSFTDNGSAIGTCSAVSVSAGNATCTLAAGYATPGSHTIGCSYTGDANFSGGTCATTAVTVADASAAIALGASVNPVATGQTVTYTATATGSNISETATRVWGQSGSFTSGVANNGGVTANSLNWNHGTVIDAAGDLYEADTSNNRVLYFPAGSTTATIAYGQNGSLTSATTNNGGLSATSLSVPKGVELDSAGNLYVADSSNNRVLFYPAGSQTATRVYGQGGSFTTGTANKGGLSASSLDQPAEILIDPLGGIYITDFGNNRVLHYPSTSTTADRVYGQGGVYTTGTVNKGGVSPISMNGPTSLDIDPSGGLYVSDTFNNRVLYFAAGSTNASRVYGQTLFSTSGINQGGLSASSLSEPHGLALDGNDNLYIADKNNNRVLFYPSGSTAATRAFGQGDVMNSSTPGTSTTALTGPYRVTLDPNGNLYVDDTGNNRILMYTTTAPTGTVTFQDGGSTIGACSNVALTGSTAQCSVTYFTSGTHNITAVYSGDGTYGAMTSAALTENVLTWSASTPPNHAGNKNNSLNAVTCVALGNCWAAGEYSTGTVDQTLTEHYNGTTWAIVSSPDVNATQNNDLNGITCVSASDCWAVGDDVVSGVTQTLTEHYDGTSWTIVASPNAGTTANNVLAGVACSSTSACWAVGNYQSGAGITQTLILFWNGASWATTASADVSTIRTDELTGVSCPAANQCVAVGYSATATGTAQTLTEGWDGVSWTIVASPNSGAAGSTLSGVSCPNTSFCMATGATLSAGAWQTLSLRWISGAWSIIASPNPSTALDNLLAGITCTSAASCVAVGTTSVPAVAPAVPTRTTLAETWNGSTWAISPSDDLGTPSNDLLAAVAATSATTWIAVGNYANANTATLAATPTLVPSQIGDLALAASNAQGSPTVNPTNGYTALTNGAPTVTINGFATRNLVDLSPTSTAWTVGNNPTTTLITLFTPVTTGVPITQVQQQGQAINGSQVSYNVTLASPITAGNALTLSYGVNDNKTITGVSGGGVTWVKAAAYNDNDAADGDTEIWYGLGATGGATTVTITFSGSVGNGVDGNFDAVNLAEWHGLSGLDRAATAYRTSGTTGSNTLTLAEAFTVANPTTTALTSTVNPTVFGQSTTFTATVSGAAPTGSVTFTDGATVLGTVALNASFQATLTTSALGVGSHSIVATYAGDSSNAASVSPTLTQVVNVAATTLGFGSSVNPSSSGQSVTFTATAAVTAPGAGTPTGTVTFLDGATTIGTGTLSGGVATFATTTLSVGAHSITATYPGDGTFAASTSGVVTQTVNALAPTIGTPTSSANPSTYPAGVTYTVSITGSGPVPTGTVTFLDGATTIGTGALDGSGVATLTIASPTVGSHSITASYPGDGTYSAGTSGVLTQVVNVGVAAVGTPLSSVNPSSAGQSVTFTVSVTGAGATPSGNVTFMDGATPLTTVALAAGSASYTTSALAVGSHLITVAYAGDSNYASATSATLTQTVSTVATTTALTSSVNPTVFGQSTTFTATVTGSAPTGSVTFTDGATVLGTVAINASFQATLTTSTLAVGSHPIVATYGGDSSNAISTSSTVTQVVNVAATTLALGSSVNPSTSGQPVTFTATTNVTAPGAGTPTGTVTFFDGATTIGTGPLSGGVATFTTSSLAVGGHSITASYPGDGTFTGSTSSVVTQNVDPLAPTIGTPTSSANPSTYPAGVTYTVSITGSGPVPTGTVTFLDGATTIGTGALNGSGVATLTIPSPTIGSHSITASYPGDGTYSPGTSGVLTQVVNAGVATVGTPVSSLNPSAFSQSVTFTVSVTGAGATPTGNVTFKDGATTLTTVALAAGSASYTTAALAVGAHSITVSYGGDANYASSASAALIQTVNAAATTTALTSSVNPTLFGQGTTFTATVTGVAPTGSVTFTDGATVLGTVAINASFQATLTTSTLAVGSHSIVATYGGDSSNAISTSPTVTQVVNVAATTLALGSSVNPSSAGQSVTFTATTTVTAPGAGTPTGTVTFLDGATTIGTGPLSGGVATFTTSSLTLGGHNITASYPGDGTFTGSTSGVVTQTVNALAPTIGTPTSSANPSTYPAGVIYTVVISGSGPVPTGTVTFLDGATAIGTGGLNGAGVASLAVASPTVGSHSITASYPGDSTYSAGTSTVLTQVVDAGVATVGTPVSSLNPSAFSQSITFTVSVTGAGATPTGNVTFKDGVTTLTTVALAAGSASYTTAALAVGAHSITVSYAGDANYASSASAALIQTVNAATTTTSLTSSVNPSVFGQSTTLTATVTGVAPTGSVTFTDGATVLGTVAINASFQATLTTSTLAVGSHPIVATYGGDSSNAISTSPTVTQVVNVAATTLALGSSVNPSAAGQSVTFTAITTVTAPGSGTPTGTVTFLDGATSIGTGTLSGGVATFATSTLALGGHSITATYAGDGTFGASASGVVAQTVNALVPTVGAPSSTSNPSAVAQSVTFTVAVTGAGPTPTGSVTFKDGAATLTTVALSAGSASYTTAALAVGSHSISVSYAGDATYSAATSATLTQTVVLAVSTAGSVGSSSSPSAYGVPVTFTSTITGAGPTPTGSVTFFDGATVLGTGTLDAGGTAAYTTSTTDLGVGTHTIAAVYSGDATYAGSTSAGATQTVTLGTATVSAPVVSPPTAQYGAGVTITTTITGAGVVPGGTVTFFDNGVAVGTGTVDASGDASFSTSPSVGGQNWSVSYSGDGNYGGVAEGAPTAATTTAATTTVSSVITQPGGTSVAVSINVSSSTGAIPGGGYTIEDNGTAIASGVLDASGNAVWTASDGSLPAGSNVISVVYTTGSTDFTSSTGAPTTITLGTPPTPTSVPTATPRPTSSPVRTTPEPTSDTTVTGTTPQAFPTATPSASPGTEPTPNPTATAGPSSSSTPSITGSGGSSGGSGNGDGQGFFGAILQNLEHAGVVVLIVVVLAVVLLLGLLIFMAIWLVARRRKNEDQNPIAELRF